MSLEKHYSPFRSNGDPINDINKTKVYNICVKSYNSPIEDHFNSLVDDGGGGFFDICINDEDECDYDILINNRDN